MLHSLTFNLSSFHLKIGSQQHKIGKDLYMYLKFVFKSHNEISVLKFSVVERFFKDIFDLFFKDPRHLIKEDSEEKEQFDPRAILANLPPLPALEAFNKHRDFLANSQNLLAGLGGHAGRIPFSSASVLGFQPPHTTFSPIPPARPPSQPTTPSSQQSSSPNLPQTQQNFSSQQNWSFEEQFKQVS